MQRWQEEHERIQADFMRCIRSFRTMSSIWGKLALLDASPGANAYAKKKSAMFKKMENNAVRLFDHAGYHDLRVKLENGEPLVVHIQAERNKPENTIPETQTEVSRPFQLGPNWLTRSRVGSRRLTCKLTHLKLPITIVIVTGWILPVQQS